MGGVLLLMCSKLEVEDKVLDKERLKSGVEVGQ